MSASKLNVDNLKIEELELEEVQKEVAEKAMKKTILEREKKVQSLETEMTTLFRRKKELLQWSSLTRKHMPWDKKTYE